MLAFSTGLRILEKPQIMRTPRRQGRYFQGVELLEKALRSHFAARGERKQAGRSTSVIWGIQQRDPAHFEPGHLSEGLDDDPPML
jgi:hypothetical protein